MRLARWVIVASMAACACGKSQRIPQGAATESMPAPMAAAPCAHAVCAENFFVDALPGDCVTAADCVVKVKLVATGAFHINDEYPYRFVGDGDAGVEFVPKDPSGSSVFSKASGDWEKEDAKVGTMTLRMHVPAAGERTIGGLFKLSVCSEQACLLEQRHVAAKIVPR